MAGTINIDRIEFTTNTSEDFVKNVVDRWENNTGEQLRGTEYEACSLDMIDVIIEGFNTGVAKEKLAALLAHYGQQMAETGGFRATGANQTPPATR